MTSYFLMLNLLFYVLFCSGGALFFNQKFCDLQHAFKATGIATADAILTVDDYLWRTLNSVTTNTGLGLDRKSVV